MSEEPDNLDRMIGAHLSRELDAHVGKAAAAFLLQERTDRRRWNLRLWGVSLATGAIAACLMLAWMLPHIHKNPGLTKTSGPDKPSIPNLVPVEQLVSWNTVDEGTVVLEDNTPARKVRYQFIRQVQYYDAEHKTTVEMTVPSEQVMYLALNSY